MTASYTVHLINTSHENDHVSFNLKQPDREWISVNTVVQPNNQPLSIAAQSIKTVQLHAKGIFLDALIGQAVWGKDKASGAVDLRLIWQGFGIYALLNPKRVLTKGQNSVLFPVTSVFPDIAKNAPVHELFLFNANTELPEIRRGYPSLSILFAPQPGVSPKNYQLEMHDLHSGKDYILKNFNLINGFTLLSTITPWIIFGASAWGIEFHCKIRDLEQNVVVDEFKYSFMSWEGIDNEMSYTNAGGAGKIEGAKHTIQIGTMDLASGAQSKVFWPGHCTSMLMYSK